MQLTNAQKGVAAKCLLNIYYMPGTWNTQQVKQAALLSSRGLQATREDRLKKSSRQVTKYNHKLQQMFQKQGCHRIKKQGCHRIKISEGGTKARDGHTSDTKKNAQGRPPGSLRPRGWGAGWQELAEAGGWAMHNSQTLVSSLALTMGEQMCTTKWKEKLQIIKDKA